MQYEQLKFFDEYRYNIFGIGVAKYGLANTPLIHNHDYYEFEFVIKGSGVHCINGVERYIEAGFFHGLGVDDYHTIKAESISLYNLKIPLYCKHEIIMELVNKLSYPFYGQLKGDKYDYIKGIFDKLHNSVHTNESYSEYKVIAGALNIISEFADNYESVEAPSRSVDSKINYVRSSIRYMKKNYSLQVTLNDVAKHINVSPNYLSSIFPEVTGIGFNEYLNAIRLDCFRERLINSDDSVLSIANSCGFSSISSLNRLFKKNFGNSPTEYKKEFITKAHS